MNTMRELKEEVLDRLQHLDGRYFESVSTVSIEQMLGIIDMDEEFHHEKINGSILDSDHDFWDDYVRVVVASAEARQEVETAIRLLKDENRFEVHDSPDPDLSGVSISVASTGETTEDFDLTVEEAGGNLALQVTKNGNTYETILTKK